MSHHPTNRPAQPQPCLVNPEVIDALRAETDLRTSRRVLAAGGGDKDQTGAPSPPAPIPRPVIDPEEPIVPPGGDKIKIPGTNIPGKIHDAPKKTPGTTTNTP